MSARKTILSDDRKYRYVLWREWSCSPENRSYAMFIGLNPSTADETQDDPTIRRCAAFAKSWGYGALCMTNLFAFRATQPNAMTVEKSPVGPDNDAWLLECAKHAGVIVAAWGAYGRHLSQSAHLRGMLGTVLSYLRQGMKEPCHPLYLPGNLVPISYDAAFNTWLRRVTVVGVETLNLRMAEINVVPAVVWRRRFDVGLQPGDAWREELGGERAE